MKNTAKKTTKIIEGDFVKKNAAKYLQAAGFDASVGSFEQAEKENGYFERFNSPDGEAWAGFINVNKIEINIYKH